MMLTSNPIMCSRDWVQIHLMQFFNLLSTFFLENKYYLNPTTSRLSSRHTVVCQRPRKSCGTQVSRHTVVCQRPRKSCGTQVSYLQEPLSHHFQHVISSITTGPISIKCTYFMPSIYTTLHTKFEENRLSSL